MMIVLSVVPFVHMAYAAYKVNQGVDYRYPFVADLIGGSRRSGTLQADEGRNTPVILPDGERGNSRGR